MMPFLAHRRCWSGIRLGSHQSFTTKRGGAKAAAGPLPVFFLGAFAKDSCDTGGARPLPPLGGIGTSSASDTSSAGWSSVVGAIGDAGSAGATVGIATVEVAGFDFNPMNLGVEVEATPMASSVGVHPNIPHNGRGNVVHAKPFSKYLLQTPTTKTHELVF